MSSPFFISRSFFQSRRSRPSPSASPQPVNYWNHDFCLDHSPARALLDVPAHVRHLRAEIGTPVRKIGRKPQNRIARGPPLYLLDGDRLDLGSGYETVHVSGRAPASHAQATALVRRSRIGPLDPRGRAATRVGRNLETPAQGRPALESAPSVARAPGSQLTGAIAPPAHSSLQVTVFSLRPPWIGVLVVVRSLSQRPQRLRVNFPCVPKPSRGRSGCRWLYLRADATAKTSFSQRPQRLRVKFSCIPKPRPRSVRMSLAVFARRCDCEDEFFSASSASPR